MKKFLAILLALVMVLSLVACAQAPAEQPAKEPEASAPAAEDKPAESEDKPAADEPVVEEGPVTLHIAGLDSAACTYFDGEDITNNWWTKQFKERFNVEVITDWSTNDAETYNTKINMAMVSGDIPDTFKVHTLTQLEQLVAADLVMDLTDVYNEYASDLLKSLCEADMDTLNTGVIDGKMFGIAHMHYGWSTQPYYIWLRDDWMKEQNLSAPKTIEDLENIMKVFSEEYGAWGYGVDKTLIELYQLAPAWGAYPNIWVTNDVGTMEPGSIQPEMKEALATFARWYAEGYIDPNFTTYDYNAMNTAAVNGTNGATAYQQWWGYIPGPDVAAQQGADAIFYPYEMPSGTVDYRYQISFDNGGYTVVSKDCKNPEAVIELMNFYAYVYYGDTAADEAVQTFLADPNANGYAHITGPFRTTNTQSEDQNLEQVKAALASGDPSNCSSTAIGKYNGSLRWINDQDTTGLGDYMQHGAGDRAAFQLANNLISEKRYILNGLWGKTPEIMGSYGTTLDDLLLEGFTKIIIGEESLDYFDTLVANWRSAGGDQVIAAVNEMYG